MFVLEAAAALPSLHGRTAVAVYVSGPLLTSLFYKWNQPILRGIASQVAGPDRRGEALSSLATTLALTSALGPLLFNPLYSATAATFAGTAMLLSAACNVVAIAIGVTCLQQAARPQSSAPARSAVYAVGCSMHSASASPKLAETPPSPPISHDAPASAASTASVGVARQPAQVRRAQRV
eukprot:SAG11_NODE_9308_length_923_cov_2.396845_2_plen_180_part_00